MLDTIHDLLTQGPQMLSALVYMIGFLMGVCAHMYWTMGKKPPAYQVTPAKVTNRRMATPRPIGQLSQRQRYQWYGNKLLVMDRSNY